MSDDPLERLTKKTVSRRDFLKIAGVAGVTVGASAGLGGLLAACGETEESTTTTAAATSTTGGATTTTAASGATTTTAATSAEMGGEVKLGFVVPLTGTYSLAAVPDEIRRQAVGRSSSADGRRPRRRQEARHQVRGSGQSVQQ